MEKENYGDLESLKLLGKNKKYPYTTEQLLDENLKNLDGESRAEVTCRFEEAFNSILSQNSGKNLVIVSHGAAIKFLLLKWCTLNDNYELEYNNKEIKLNSPGVIKLTFSDKNLLNLEQIV